MLNAGHRDASRRAEAEPELSGVGRGKRWRIGRRLGPGGREADFLLVQPELESHIYRPFAHRLAWADGTRAPFRTHQAVSSLGSRGPEFGAKRACRPGRPSQTLNAAA
jgi:hypothetical protein